MSDDLIRRSDAIEAIHREARLAGGSVAIEYADMFQYAIKDIPSADRPQGEWEIVGKNHPYKRCPFCKRVRAFTDTRFCDWCGADMREGE